MIVIYITSRFPYPINKGDKLRSYYQIKELSKKNDVHLIALSENKVSKSSINELKKYCQKYGLHCKLLEV
mgnify:CR=1 FL=1